MTDKEKNMSMTKEKLLNAYLDDELAPAELLAFEDSLAEDAELRARLEQLQSLRQALIQADDEAGLSDQLRQRLEQSYSSPIRGREKTRWNIAWGQIVASLSFGAAFASALLVYTPASFLTGRDSDISQAVSNHMRSLLAPQPFDVASSDRHAVKPWLISKSPRAPRAPDLAKEGYTLTGARLDVIDRAPVGVVVYHLREHNISVFLLPPGRPAPSPQTIAGFSSASWQEDDFTYVAVSDMPETELLRFRAAFEQSRTQGE